MAAATGIGSRSAGTALIEMIRGVSWGDVVGLAGFEPAASCSQSKRASQAALQPADKRWYRTGQPCPEAPRRGGPGPDGLLPVGPPHALGLRTLLLCRQP